MGIDLKGAISSLLERGIGAKAFPGAVAAVVLGDEVAVAAAGDAQVFPVKREMVTSTPFDLASLTKVIVTTTLLMKSVERGLIDLWDPVSDYVDFAGQARIINLANHSSGLPAWVNLQSFGNVEAAAKFIAGIRGFEPGQEELYSDLGFILLGYIIERVNGKGLRQLAQEEIFDPLNMRGSCFSPCEGAASTEVVDGKAITGVVHDENARALGGVCGHAGAFSTAADLAAFASALLRGRLLSKSSIEVMTDKANAVKGGNHAVGWQVITEKVPPWAGSLLSGRAFGHTGFTGTSIWIDPEMDAAGILLTNAVHYGRGRDINPYRRAFADIVASARSSSRVRRSPFPRPSRAFPARPSPPRGNGRSGPLSRSPPSS